MKNLPAEPVTAGRKLYINEVKQDEKCGMLYKSINRKSA